MIKAGIESRLEPFGQNGHKGTDSIEANPKYTLSTLGSYDSERHILLDSAYKLIGGESLPADRLKSSVDAGEIKVYDFKGTKYLDRLDIGRVYHQLKTGEGLSIERYFTDGKVNPLDSVKYEARKVEIKDSGGKVVFSMETEFPREWSDTAASIVAQKYFYRPNSPDSKKKLMAKIGKDHEYSPRHIASRVTNFVADMGLRLGYFKNEEDKTTFADELNFLQIHQMFAFNSPVKFNAGIFNEYGVAGSNGRNFFRDSKTGKIMKVEIGEYVNPQCHACFIKGPRDDLESILQHFVDEGSIFAAGSGIGQDIGKLRGEGEPLSGGGKASGPMSFLKVYDSAAGTIKSGGKSRRAARMSTMRYQHQDIMAFVRSKVSEDGKAYMLMKKGYSTGMDGDAYSTVAYQNTNISVRLDKEFFEKVDSNGEVELRRVTDGKVVSKINAQKMLKEISFGTWRVGDPGVQYETPIQEMHTSKNSGRINSTNPCSEYVFLDDTSCNLASTNLLAFSDISGKFDVEKFNKANRLITIAQDIINDAASYPVKDIAEISPEFRTIGLGYANLGALLMRRGVAYDSDEGRSLAAAITALMTGVAYETSTEMAEKLEPFTHFEFNKKPMLKVMHKHKQNLENVVWETVPSEIKEAAYKTWENVVKRGEQFGYRNAQTTVLAPTGTIAYWMDCDTPGVEPSIALSIEKDLAGGGKLTLVNKEVPNALRNLKYTDAEVRDILEYIKKKNKVLGAPHLNPDHYSVFATAFGNERAEGAIPFEGHVKMLGATQPFISGAISKTNNMPEPATVKDIYEGYIMGHKLGIKAISMFRNNSKPVSALNFGGKSYVELNRGEKEDLPSEGDSFRKAVTIDGAPLLMIVGEHKDGRPAEVVFEAFGQGSMVRAMLATHGILASKALKRGVKLEDVVSAWRGQEFAPKGLVAKDNRIKTALSPLDYAAKVLLLHYAGMTDLADNKEGLTLRELRGAKTGAFRTYRMMEINDWNLDQVLASPEYGGFIEVPEDQKMEVNGNGHKIPMKNSRGVTCTSCGNLMRQTAPNCFSCSTCGDKLGGCGL